VRLGLALLLSLALLSIPAPTTDPVAPRMVRVVADQPPAPVGVFAGTATWYDAARGPYSAWYTRAGIKYYGAIGAAVRKVKQHYWRTSWEVRITSLLTGRSVVVQVVDECTCYGVRKVKGDERLIDLAPAVWQALGVPLGRGVMPIVLEVLP
jgi:hypothetical protein